MALELVRADRLPISVEHYGAKGDGTTDDTTTLQSAIDNLPANATLVFSAGKTYRISSALIPKASGQRFVGYGATINQVSSTATAFAAPTAGITKLGWEGLTLTGASTTSQTSVIAAEMPDDSYMRNCTVGGFNICASVYGSRCRIVNNDFTSAVGHNSGQGYGVIVMAPDCTVMGNRMALIGRHGVYLSGHVTFGGGLRANVVGNHMTLDGAGTPGINTNFLSQTLVGATIAGNRIEHTNPQAGLAAGILLSQLATDCIAVANTIINTNSSALWVHSDGTNAPQRCGYVGNIVNSSSGYFMLVDTVGGTNPPVGSFFIGNRGSRASGFAVSDAGTDTVFIGNNGYADVQRVITLAVNDTAPVVWAGNVFMTANTSATSITDFTLAFNGQRISVKLDANTTIVNGSTIKTASGSNITGTANTFVSFRRIGGVWYQD